MTAILRRIFDTVRWRSPYWTPTLDHQHMKRWNGTEWETRPMTEQERDDDEWWRAIK